MNNKIEAIYYLMADASSYESDRIGIDDLLDSIKQYGKILLERDLTNETKTLLT